jgi:hypothetical protein
MLNIALRGCDTNLAVPDLLWKQLYMSGSFRRHVESTLMVSCSTLLTAIAQLMTSRRIIRLE